MKKIVWNLLTIMIAFIIIMTVNFVSFAEEEDLTEQEYGAFITREEFVIWRDGFIASLSELDRESTKRIYKDMDFYDKQYRFTDAYKNPYDKDLQPEEWRNYEDKLAEEIIAEKIKRGLI